MWSDPAIPSFSSAAIAIAVANDLPRIALSRLHGGRMTRVQPDGHSTTHADLAPQDSNQQWARPCLPDNAFAAMPGHSPPPEKAPLSDSQGQKPRPQRELTPRTTLTVAVINALIGLCLTLAHLSVFPTRPYLRPVAFLLVVLVEWSAYAAVRRSARGLLLRLRHASAPRCEKCNAPRPPRTHHCSTCRVCTPRMSHHCGVLGVCVGAHNYKAFILVIFYGAFSAALLVALCAEEATSKVSGLWHGRVRISAGVVIWLQLYYMQVCMVIILGGLFAFHLYLVAINRTMLEACVLKGLGRVFPPWKRDVAFFEKGLLGNFEEVFGGLWVALLPVVDARSAIRMEETHLHAVA